MFFFVTRNEGLKEVVSYLRLYSWGVGLGEFSFIFMFVVFSV